MDLSAAACSWAMEDPAEMAHQWELGSLDQLISENIWEDIKDYSSPSSDSHSSYPCNSFIKSNTNTSISGSSIDHYSAHIQKPKKSAKTNSTHRDSPTILSFGDDQYYSELSYENIIGVVKTEEGSEMKSLSSINGSKNKLRVRPLNSHNYQLEHVIAERKRRERLTQRFIALSAMVPGLKKMDKASVLGDAIEYIKKLEEKVKILQEEEEEAVKKKTLDKSDQLLSTNDGNSSSDENFEDKTNYSDHDILFEIEVVRLSENSILLKIRCQNHKGVLVKAVSEIENLHLTVINTSVIPFAGSLDMTVITKIEDGFSMTGKDLVKKLQSAFRGLM